MSQPGVQIGLSPDAEPQPTNVYRKVTWRLVPFLCLLYVFNILDRANVGFAKPMMQKDLTIDPGVYDLGIGIFYLGYILFEVPANLLMRRFGARIWMARIMISWGLVSAATMTVFEPVGFYAVRILLGVAEAGFFPGIILYLTYWYPARERAKVTAFFMLAIALSGIFGNPLSGLIVQTMDGFAGLQGWRWLFLVEGIPSVLLGISVFFLLPNGPDDARWLTPAERHWLKSRLLEEDLQRPPHREGLMGAFTHPVVWLLICLYFTVAIGANASGGYLPTLLKDRFTGSNPLTLGLLTALPHLAALVVMVAVAWSSDRTHERRGHVAFAALLAAGGWGIAAFTVSPWLGLFGLCLAQAGMMAMLPTFWAIPPGLLRGKAAAGGIALINSVANIGGIIGPWVLGFSLRHGERLREWCGLGDAHSREVSATVADLWATGAQPDASTPWRVALASARFGAPEHFGLVVMAATLLLGSVLALCLPRERRMEKK